MKNRHASNRRCRLRVIVEHCDNLISKLRKEFVEDLRVASRSPDDCWLKRIVRVARSIASRFRSIVAGQRIVTRDLNEVWVTGHAAACFPTGSSEGSSLSFCEITSTGNGHWMPICESAW